MRITWHGTATPEDPMKNELINADSIATMASMPDQSVDVLLTDPPYPNRQGLFSDTITDGFAGLYLGCKKTKKAVVFFWSPIAPPPLPPPGWYRNAIHIWEKPDCASKINYELIIVWTKDYRLQRHRVFTVPLLDYRSLKDWKPHPTQKPLRLIRYLLEQYTNEGDLVLDPFAGTGTTAVACKQMKRDYIAIEADHKYAAFAQERLQEQPPNTPPTQAPEQPAPNHTTPPKPKRRP